MDKQSSSISDFIEFNEIENYSKLWILENSHNYINFSTIDSYESDKYSYVLDLKDNRDNIFCKCHQFDKQLAYVVCLFTIKHATSTQFIKYWMAYMINSKSQLKNMKKIASKNNISYNEESKLDIFMRDENGLTKILICFSY